MRLRAASMSATVGLVRVAIVLLDLEYLFHDLPNRRQRVELTALHLCEQPAELGVVGDRVLEMRLRTGARHGEHLAGEVVGSTALEQAVLLEVPAMGFDLLPQLLDPL